MTRLFFPRATFLIAIVLCTLLSCNRKNDDARTQDLRRQIIFPLQDEHVHGSTIVELPNGDLLTAWFQGSGERWADDVRIMGARRSNGDSTWSEPFLMADVEGFPDINPILFMDQEDQLWLMWYPVIANQWETSIPMYRISDNYDAPGAPRWRWQDVLFVKPGDKTERGIQPNDRFVKAVADQLSAYESYLRESLMPLMPDSIKPMLAGEWEKYKVKLDSLSKGRNMVRSGRLRADGKETSAELGYPLSRRIGWQTKNKAVFIGKRMIVPLYSDGLDCTLFALSDDGGETWSFSNPVLGGAGIQATIGIAKDSMLVAYLRDNGPPPQRMQRTESRDRGLTWSIAKDDILPNPGAGFDLVTLSNGEWLIVFNDQEDGRFDLSVAISDDDGKSWKWKKQIEHDSRKENPSSSHYPSVIAGKDGTIHVVYSFHRGDSTPGKTIKYATFDLEWVKE
ncbi:MAG TPA: exo-alpha-sialidase [Chryseosolibacter sp.]|nr:exo-alpha-sialidase [Chryseosolibacter sp.]